MKIKALASLSIISMICIIFLTSCSEKSIDGEWELSQSTQNECPIYYEFKTEMKKENKQTVINHLVKMYTNKYIKEDLSKGTYTKIDEDKKDMYFLDYGNSFTSKQQIKRENDNTLDIYFENVDKTCKYKKI